MKKYFIITLILVSASLFAEPLLLEKNAALDMKGLGARSLSDLVIMRNSIFARYGYVFRSGAFRDYFSGFSWYRPDAKFSYGVVSKLDQQNVNAILAEEKRKTDDLKKSLHGKKYGGTRYFLSVKPRERIPSQTETAIRSFWKKNLSAPFFNELRIPVLLAPDTGAERDASFIMERQKNPGERFDYWKASYDEAGVIRVLKSCYCETGWPNACGDVYYFDETGRLVMVEGSVRGTTVNYEYYYQYCLDRVVWIELTLICGSAGVPDKTDKFFY
jgi:hypothetical protein